MISIRIQPVLLLLAALPLAAQDFAHDVQPIFQKSCSPCHGAKVQSAGLRLDLHDAALSKSVIPGKAAESELYKRIAGLGSGARMPLGGKLTDPEIAAVKSWIDAGAKWPENLSSAAPQPIHWAFVPPRKAPLPVTGNTKWPLNEIDRFILARLEKESLAPSSEADRTTLLRRVSLDLTGLPPTPAEVTAFLADKSPKAYEKQVDRLLASPHYGERFARQWLDAARYADSDGYEKDKARYVWFYRDWVINALNKDLPYDQFVIKQIAGDLLPNHTQDDLVATGFLRNSMINEEGGVDPEQFRMEAMYDRMDAIGKSVLGLTIQCAQCHTHKYDPITHEEYYRMFAFLNNTHESNAAVYTPAELQKRSDILRRTREIEATLQHANPGWEARMAGWEESAKHELTQWTVLKPDVDDISTGGERYLLQPDNSLLAQGYAPTKHTVKLTFKTTLKSIAAVRLELLTDPNLPLGGPGRSLKGLGALSEIEIEYNGRKVKIARASADINPPVSPLDSVYDDKKGRARTTGPIDFAIDGSKDTAWNADAGPALRNQPRKAVFNLAEPIANSTGAELTFVVKLSQEHGGWNSDDNQNMNLGRFRIAATDDPGAVADPVPAAVREIFSIPAAKRSPLQVQTIFSYWRTIQPQWETENQEIAKLWAAHPEGTPQLVLAERENMRETHQLNRGDFLQPGKLVSPGVPAFLNPLPAGQPANRLTFAKWLVDRNSPTTARALVNRLWLSFFGTGIVETAEDFGRQSAAPSHQELLDWLAVDFMEHNWSIKRLQKMIVMSATYRQSSNITPELLSKDPYNRLLARGPRFRVDAEIVRDIALSASGLLNEKVGGPSVNPPAPKFLFEPPTSYSPKVWVESKGDEKFRRALYTFRYRSSPYPMLQMFDSPNGDISCVRRSRSNTPLQALTTLNEPVFLDAARALAVKTVKEGGSSDAQRLDFMFRRVLARGPEAGERDTLLSLLSKEAGHYTAGHDPMPLIVENTTDLPPAQLAAWVTVSRVLLNLDETITKE